RLWEVAGLFLVRTGLLPEQGVGALLVDRHGVVRHRFGEAVVQALPQGPVGVVLTTTEVVGVSPAGKVLWTVPLAEDGMSTGGGWRAAGGRGSPPGPAPRSGTACSWSAFRRPRDRSAGVPGRSGSRWPTRTAGCPPR